MADSRVAASLGRGAAARAPGFRAGVDTAHLYPPRRNGAPARELPASQAHPQPVTGYAAVLTCSSHGVVLPCPGGSCPPSTPQRGL